MTFEPKVYDPRSKAQIARDESEAYELTDLRDTKRCVRCGRGDPFFGMSHDHRKGRGVGGGTVASNLQLLCGSGSTDCHGWKTSHPDDALAEGYTVPGYADPHEWPGRRWVRDGARLFQIWCTYSDDGKFTEISDREADLRMRGEWPERGV